MDYIRGTGAGILYTIGVIKAASPKHTTVDKQEQFEVRRYPKCHWVKATVKGKNFKDASSDGFWKCFRYFHGKNNQGKSMDMTVPVITIVDHREDDPSGADNSYITSMYIDESALGGKLIPKPTEEGVVISARQELSVLVRQFSGFTGKEDVWIAESKKLMLSLKDKEHDELEQHPPIYVEYDVPFKLMNRRNEIWFVTKPTPPQTEQSQRDTTIVREELEETAPEENGDAVTIEEEVQLEENGDAVTIEVEEQLDENGDVATLEL